MKRKIKMSVSRTIQVERFEPVTVQVEEEIVVSEEDAAEARDNLYRAVTQQVKKYIDNERRKYAKQND